MVRSRTFRSRSANAPCNLYLHRTSEPPRSARPRRFSSPALLPGFAHRCVILSPGPFFGAGRDLPTKLVFLESRPLPADSRTSGPSSLPPPNSAFFRIWGRGWGVGAFVAFPLGSARFLEPCSIFPSGFVVLEYPPPIADSCPASLMRTPSRKWMGQVFFLPICFGETS